MSLDDLAYYSTMSDKEKIAYLENSIEELEVKATQLMRALAVQNQDRLDKVEEVKAEEIHREETMLEAFSSGLKYVQCVITHHKDSEFIDINFLPLNNIPLSISMTRKAFDKLCEVIENFKSKEN